jgi:hypothetical protein
MIIAGEEGGHDSGRDLALDVDTKGKITAG